MLIAALLLSPSAKAQESADTLSSVATQMVQNETEIGNVVATTEAPSSPVDSASVGLPEPVKNLSLRSESEPEPARPLSLSDYEPPHAMDWNMIRSRTNPAVKPYTFWQDQTWVGLPLFVAGLIAKAEKTAFRQNYNNPNTRIRLIKYNFHSEIDNYTQFVPLALTIGLKLGGVESRSDWPRFWASAAMSSAIMAGIVNGVKYTASEMRPDGSTRNSWPSGHTATAFLAATILHKEYGLTQSPWYSVGAYTLATVTGVMRVLNNRHWISDVLSGAGIGILSVELGYGICDLLFKGRGLQRGDLDVFPDLREKPSFFAISMGVGLGNRHLNMPAFDFHIPQHILDAVEADGITEEDTGDPLSLKFRSATAVGAEAAWFFSRYVGLGARMRVKSTPINGWSAFAMSENAALQRYMKDPDLQNAISNIALTIESDHITEFAFDAGLYFNLPFSSRFALGSKLLVGRSVLDDIDVNASFAGKQMKYNSDSHGYDDQWLVPTDKDVSCKWDYVNVSESNSMKFGTGLSLTYAHKNAFSFRVFCDYDFARKTFKASYNPMGFFQELVPDLVSDLKGMGWDVLEPATSSLRKNLHQWVLGGALCVSF